MRRHDAGGGQTHSESVTVVALDDAVTDLGRRVSLVKMDVEGFEFEVLAGGEQTISRHRPVLYTEMSPEWLSSRGVPESALADWMAAHGYRCHEVRLERRDRWSDHRRVELREIAGAHERRGGDLLLVPAAIGEVGR